MVPSSARICTYFPALLRKSDCKMLFISVLPEKYFQPGGGEPGTDDSGIPVPIPG